MLQLEDDMRFEVVDSNEDERHSIGIDTAFFGDGFDLTEGVLATQQQARPTYYDRHASYPSETDMNNNSGGVRQLAYRDKEEQLVQIAMERIRRAQALGESNVRLTKPELDALARKRRKNQTMGRNTALSRRSSNPSNMNQRSSAVVEPKSSKRRVMLNNSGYDYSGPSIHGNSTSQVTAASLRHENQQDLFPGYFRDPQAGPYDDTSMLSGTRSAGSHSPLHQNPPPTASRPRDQQKRYFSVPKGFGSSPAAEIPAPSRRLPDDPNWIPRARSASSNQPYMTGDIPQSAYTPSPLNVAPSRPPARRSVFDNYKTHPSNWERGIQPPMAVTTPPQLTFSRYEGSDEPMSIPSYANDSGDDGYNDYSAELDYVPYHEPDIPRGPFEGYPRR